MLLGCYRNLTYVLSLLVEEIIDLFLVWQARHHWALAWKLAVISITGVGIEGRGTLRKLKIQQTWRLAQYNCMQVVGELHGRRGMQRDISTPFPHSCFKISSFSWEYITTLSVLVTEWMLTMQNSRLVVTWYMCSSKQFIYRIPCH